MESWSGAVGILTASSTNDTWMSGVGVKDKELAGGDVGAGSDGVAEGELVMDGKRIGDGRK